MKKGQFSTILLFLIFFTGLSLLLYPSLSDYWNSMHQSRAISDYSKKVTAINEEEYYAYLQEATEYNDNIRNRANVYAQTDDEKERYKNILNISGNGVLGYIEIPAIDVILPIYHGTSESVLQVAIGHLDWTSFPVGGESTHSVLSGHRGLPSAKLFTHLDKLTVGDVFMIRVLNEVLTYEVDQILIVKPNETEALKIVNGEDYCTLVTCTPYGINTHRLLVRGHRIENAEQAVTVHIISEAIQIEPTVIAAVVGVPALMMLMILVYISNGEKNTDPSKQAKEKNKKTEYKPQKRR